VVLRGALAETVDRASLVAARKVFVDGFLASRRAYELEISRIPLAEMFDTRLGQWLAERRAAVHRGCRVRQIEGDGRRAAALAVPWHRVTKLLAGPLVDAIPALRDSAQIEPVPITAIHLWFDRPITELPHAVLVGRLSQWVFADQFGGTGVSPVRRRSTGETPVPPDEPERLHHYQVVISGSQDLSQRRREDVLAQVQSELEAIWPAARTAQLVRWRMVTEPAAAFSMRPGIDRLRPPQETPVANLAICGDWTATGWPATMEGAVRSGYAAAEVIQKAVEENNE
jgi:hypothetical protein